MAEYLGMKKEPRMDGFDRMGQPISTATKELALSHCAAMGLSDKARAFECVSSMSNQLERDKPYEAMAVGMLHLDLTGTYRLMAVLLTADAP